MEGDLELVQIIVESAIEECPQQLDAIRQAILHRDASVLRLASHTLRLKKPR